jgi:long-chain acyl-CoA synthetase
MSFWSFDAVDAERPALLWDAPSGQSIVVTYAELVERADAFAARLGAQSADKCLGVILCENSPAFVYAYIAALRRGDAVMLWSARTDPDLLDRILDRYVPEWLFQSAASAAPAGYEVDGTLGEGVLLRRSDRRISAPMHPDLAVLLSTSGSTGSPKMVRLSHRNVASNAASIVEYLAIGAGDRAVTNLPMSYSYGMSVVNSHLQAGAALVLTETSLMNREFWESFRRYRVTSLAGVPYTYQMLHRLKLGSLPVDSLRSLTQAGGRLDPMLVEYFRELATERGWRFFVMYGQTEAAPRISYVPPESLATKIGSIGIAIPGGRLSLTSDAELMYEGPNVMLGYALQREDLSLGDEQHGRLATGDLATVDEDGFFYLQGRLKRFVKIQGNRVNLDDIEQRLEAELRTSVAVLGKDDALRVYVPRGAEVQLAQDTLRRLYRLHPTTFAIREVDAIPYTGSGKKDYSALAS